MSTTFYHGSEQHLPVGTVLSPRDDYEDRWHNTPFYQVLEMYRPAHCLAHRNAVFMCDNQDDIDSAGGSTDYLFTVKPLGPVSKHDMNWSSEICSLISEGHEFDSDEVYEAAQSYWAGEAHPDESIWEYLCSSAIVVNVEEY